ncbi:MAG: PEGA domain-containing protein, partial [Deltaproteobacteria bacterium]|nr:PEGA domain-containing protein [Deltaproteobacteria bacterium]
TGLRPVTVVKWISGVLLGVALVLVCAAAGFVFTARQVVITITPVPESVTVSGGIVTPRIGEYYLMRPGEYRVTAFKACYAPVEKMFEVSTDKRQNLVFEMQKLPGRLVIRTHQSGVVENSIAGARVHIDNTDAGTTPVENLELMPGLKKIDIRAENYQVFQTEVDVKGCGELQTFTWALLPAWSDVTFRSFPPGANVKIDGQSIGNTPLSRQLAAGSYLLEISADRHKPWKQRLVVEPNEPQKLSDIRLKPADGSVAIKTKPAGANVIIDGIFVGQTPMTADLSPSEDHVVQVSKAGYEKASRKINIPSSASKQLDIDLKVREGIVYIMVVPSDAELLVNGKSWGHAPAQLRLVATTHTLEFKKKGYQSYRIQITPRPGYPQQLKIALENEQTPRKAALDTIATQTGYVLKLIRPEPFIMGSSRREQGRRSNETLRKIKLTRPFYMGVTEVTNKAFNAFRARHNSGVFKSYRLNKADQPVVRVTWEDAALFCNWLSAKAALPPAYIQKGDKLVPIEPLNTGYRLPTEAEWEYTARHIDAHTSLKYPWGETFPPKQPSGNYSDQSAKDLLPTIIEDYNDGYAVPAPPAKFKPDRLGLYDMGGNVAEWCHDYYSIYTYAPERTYADPAGPGEGKHHVIRGSSWKSGSISTLRLAYRSYDDDKREDVGFRVCRYLK